MTRAGRGTPGKKSGAACAWVLADYVPGDEERIIRAFEQTFSRPMGRTESRAHWRWEYLDNPEKPLAIKLAWDRDTLVGHYAVSPVRMSLDGTPLPACLSLDTLTHRDYRLQGVFSRTARALYDDVTARGLAFVYGFPNRESNPGMTRVLGWTTRPAPVWLRPHDVSEVVGTLLGSRRLARLAGSAGAACSRGALALSRRGRGVEVREEHAFGEWADDLWQRICGQHRLWLVRDRKYLSWRYARPESTYRVLTAWSGSRPCGFIVWTDEERNGLYFRFIMELSLDPAVEGCGDALLGEAVRAESVRPIAALSALAAPACTYRPLLRRYLFARLPEALFPQQFYFGGLSFGRAVCQEMLADPSVLHITWGDTDLL